MRLFKWIAIFGCIAVGVWFFKVETYPIVDNVVFKTMTAKPFVLKQQGRVTVVTFWATNCPSCIKEIALFKQLYRQYHPQGLEVIAVAMAYNPPNRVVEMVRNLQIPYGVVLDLRGHYAEAFGQVQLIPTTFLVDSSGKIVLKQTGLFSLQSMQQQIEYLLKG